MGSKNVRPHFHFLGLTGNKYFFSVYKCCKQFDFEECENRKIIMYCIYYIYSAAIALFNNYNNIVLPSFTGRFRWPSHLWWEFRRHCFMGNRLCSSVLSWCLHKSQELQPLDWLDHHLWELKLMFCWMWEDFP